MFTQPRRSTQPTKLHPLQRTRQRTRKFLIGANFCVGGGGGGWDRGSESPVSPTTFSRLPYFCVPLPPDSRPSLCCSRLKFNQPGFFVGGGGVDGTGGQSLPFPLPRSPAFRTFVPLCLPTPTLHCVAPVFRLIKRIRNPGLTFKLC